MPNAPRHDPSGATSVVTVDVSEDALLPLVGCLFAALVLVVVAAPALITAVAAYWVATWRRWPWWLLTAAGIAGLLSTVAISGPVGAVHHHLLAVRDLSDTHGFLAVAIKHRWAAWLTAQLPLSVPIGLLIAGFARPITRRAGDRPSP